MKAKAGVTLVELLVVILIVTILSVGMLPLLQPFVVEAKYAAEPIPVIGNLRTKIGLYQYEKGKLPCIADNVKDPSTGKETPQIEGTPQIETWIPTATENGTTIGDASAVDYFTVAKVGFPASEPPLTGLAAISTSDADLNGTLLRTKHLSARCDIDYQELKGANSKPHHYQYLVMRNGTSYAYFLGCFGDGNGLKMGTGYAVCEIVADGHKYVGTWKRYKPVTNSTGDDIPVCFTSASDPNRDGKKQLGCVIPDRISIDMAADNGSGKLDIVADMEGFGWEF